MATWEQVRKEAPELAEAVQERFDAFLHKTIATLRKDGSPRISGIEATFSGGELRLGMMPDSLKFARLWLPTKPLPAVPRSPPSSPRSMVSAFIRSPTPSGQSGAPASRLGLCAE